MAIKTLREVKRDSVVKQARAKSRNNMAKQKRARAATRKKNWGF